MSIEQKLDALTDAVVKLTEIMQNGTPIHASVEQTSEPSGDAAAKGGSNKADQEADLVWYHKPETKEVWQEEEAGKRKGIVKVAEKTAKDLIAKYEAEAEEDQTPDPQADESTESGDDNFGMELDEDDGGDAKFDESQPIDNDAFGKHWREFTQAATKTALENGAPDDEEAQKEVKKFVIPLVKKYGTGDKPKIASIPEDKRAAFLNEAQGFFA